MSNREDPISNSFIHPILIHPSLHLIHISCPMTAMEYQTSPIPPYVHPDPSTISTARSAIHTALPDTGIGAAATSSHISTELCPGFEASGASPRYYGFVTGGATPAALAADHVVSEYDQNLHTHLPDERIGTDVEFHALGMLCQLLGLRPGEWGHKVFTTGATAANIVGLACAREFVVAETGRRLGRESSVASSGLIRAVLATGRQGIQVLTSAPHSSLRKACSVVGLGHECVVDVGQASASHRMDLGLLEKHLADETMLSIIAISCAEVQTGLFATSGLDEMKKIRALADKAGAWVHVDAAFGLIARILPDTTEYAQVKKGVEGIELADSIAGDAHKLFNVPYDAGFLLSRPLQNAFQVFQNPGAPYLSASVSAIPSPLNIGIENSRRFRGLPVYASLVAYGRTGYTDMLQRQIALARRVAEWIRGMEGYELLPEGMADGEVFVIVLFRARDEVVNTDLKTRINAQRRIYCSGTTWDGRPAVRLAVGNWMVDEKRDGPVVEEVLARALEG